MFGQGASRTLRPTVRRARLAFLLVGLAWCRFAVAGPKLPPECEMPAPADVGPLRRAAQQDSTLSMGLDAVATWCFDPQGTWSGGWKLDAGQPPPDSVSPDCLRAIQTCESADHARRKSGAIHALDAQALADMERPFRASRYKPQRAGIHDRPSDAVDCRSNDAAQLRAMARNRSEISRVHAQIQSEYAAYRKWLYAEALKCRNEVLDRRRHAARTQTEVGVSARTQPEAKAQPARDGETPVQTESSPAAPTSSAQASSTVAVIAPGPKEARAAALSAPMPQKWHYLAGQAGLAEADPDYRSVFLQSQEANACACPRVNPAAISRAIERREGGDSGLALLAAEDEANTKCAVCFLDAYAAWKGRALRECARMRTISDAELLALEQSPAARELPPRCFAQARAARPPAPAGSTASAAVSAPRATAVSSTPVANGPSPTAVAPVAANSPVPNRTAPAVVAPGATPVANGASPAAVAPVAANSPATNRTAPTVVAQGTAGTYGAAATPTPVAIGSSQTVVAPGAVGPEGLTTAPSAAASGPSPSGIASGAASGSLQTVNGYTYYRPPEKPAPAPASSLGEARAPAAPSSAGAAVRGSELAYDAFVPPDSYAPVPPREEGRLYVRLSMSSACVAEIAPGPIHARNGDLLVVPIGAQSLEVKSPCGGVAEIYYGKEPTPRFSEIFGRNQPVSFVFRPE